jgi:hypothetical protein
VHHPHPTEPPTVIERNLLRILCRTGTSVLQPETLASLRQNAWANPDHQVVFEALLRLANVPPGSLCARLPAEAARLGFPDIPWDAYFESANGASKRHAFDEQVAQWLAQTLTESTDRQ